MGVAGNIKILIGEDKGNMEFKARTASHTEVLKHIFVGHIWRMTNRPVWPMWRKGKAK